MWFTYFGVYLHRLRHLKCLSHTFPHITEAEAESVQLYAFPQAEVVDSIKKNVGTYLFLDISETKITTAKVY